MSLCFVCGNELSMKTLVLVFLMPLSLASQDNQVKWFDIHAQATTITQAHGPFNAPYSGKNSLRPFTETDTSVTTTLSLRLTHQNTELGFDGEVAGGNGFSGVAGIAAFPNGEITKIGKPAPTPYVARLFLKQQVSHFTWIAGKMSAEDFFDNNAYSHEPRTQFMNWSIMYNGAWDYPADTRGYTVGALLEFAFGPFRLRAGSFLEPVWANGPKLDGHFAASRGDVWEWQYQYAKGGVVRVMSFMNHGNMGTYRRADQDIVVTRKPGTAKYGFGLNVEQRITGDVGVFGRLGWNDGKTESWAFTEIDRTASSGLSLRGSRWHRQDDVFGAAVAVNGISGDHRAYLARGGYGFMIGDGMLARPDPEELFEAYYAWRVQKVVTISADYQRIVNPAYNQDRGPITVFSLRLHVEH
jgi:high affinity Mn2+ porin